VSGSWFIGLAQFKMGDLKEALDCYEEALKFTFLSFSSSLF